MTPAQIETMERIAYLLKILDENEDAVGYITPEGNCFDYDLIEMALGVVENLHQMELEF